MQRQRGGLVPIGEVVSGLDGPVPVIPAASPQARRGFTVADQVNQLVRASEADPDLGFMARLMALCSLPRTNPGNRKEYVRRNGPYPLVMSAGGLNKLPYGNFPRLLLAWLCSEAVKTRSQVLVVGTVARQVHANARDLPQQRRARWRSNPPPQPDAASLRLHRSTVLQG